jgi:hypothetical protein
VLRQTVFAEQRVTALWWLPISLAAWIGGESVAFAFQFVPESVPLVGGVIGAITGLGLVWLLRHVHRDGALQQAVED